VPGRTFDSGALGGSAIGSKEAATCGGRGALARGILPEAAAHLATTASSNRPSDRTGGAGAPCQEAATVSVHGGYLSGTAGDGE